MHTLTHDEQALIELVRGYVVAELGSATGPHGFPRQRFAELAAMDLPSLPFAEADGGVAVTLRTTGIVVEELARGHAAVGIGLAIHLAATLAVEAAVGPGEDTAGLRRLVLGEELSGTGMDDARSGQPTLRLHSTASGAHLDGTASSVLLPDGADRFVTVAHDASGNAHLVIIPTDSAHGELRSFAPEGPIPVVDVVFEMAALEGVVASGEQTAAAIDAAADAAFILAAACAIGIGLAVIDDVVLASTQEDDGLSIGLAEDAVREVVAEMAARTEAARSLTRSAAERRDHARGIGPHRHAPRAGSGYRFRRAAAASWLSAHTAASSNLRDAERILEATRTSVELNEERTHTLRTLRYLAGSMARARREIGGDVLGARGSA